MDCTAWTDDLGSEEAERLLRKIEQTLDFELKHVWWTADKEDLDVWWYVTRWVDGKCLETSEAVCYPESCDGFRDYAFSKPRRLLQAVLQTRVFKINVHKDGRRWQESCFVLNPLFGCKSLEELEITLDLLGEKKKKIGEAAENEH